MSGDSLSSIRVIAIIGISASPDRPSFQVASYLRNNNFEIIPINPALSEWEGVPAYPDLKHVPQNITIDVVNIFRKREHILVHVREAAERDDVSLIWLPEGIIVPEAEQIAARYGKQLVMNACMMKQHSVGENPVL